ncbi:MAG TPA: hypothetical protein PK294_00075 [Ignavibacteria bacterium]|nr:hypothetical protein [Ignavibacteria bacterium]HQY52236.1 hypothetical protein [Ignavibacteria bacterium]HRA98806.1 hypothetical protein [Ignavibacteria bacterium]
MITRNIYAALFILFILNISSCSEENSLSVKNQISSADKIEFLYKDGFDSTGKMIVKTSNITNQKDIIEIINTVSDEPFPYQYCISTGSMTFYKQDSVLISLVYNTTDDYRHIAFNQYNKLTAVKLSEENARLLELYSAK